MGNIVTCVCLHLCVCLPDSIIHHFQCKYGLAFLCLFFFFPPSFVYYLLCWGSQCLGRIESWVAIMPCVGVIIMFWYKCTEKVLAVCCSTLPSQTHLFVFLALIARVCRLHYFTNNRQTQFSNTISVSGLSSGVFPQSTMVAIHFALSIHAFFLSVREISHAKNYS